MYSIEKTEIGKYESIIRNNKIKTFNFLHNYEPFDLEGELKFNFSDQIFIVFILFIILYILLIFT